MIELTIGKTRYEGKTNFKFEKLAEKKYKKEQGGQELSGLESIYQDLLSYKASALVDFWDCATAHYKKEQPIVDEIEDALEKIIEEEGTDRLFKEAFNTLDESGFFKKQLNEFWNNLDMAEKMTEDETELKQIRAAKKMYKDKRKELKA